MKPRPFKFFFGIALGTMLFFFLARFVIMAAIIAAMLSFVFYLGRKMKNFFHNLDWEDNYNRRTYQKQAYQGQMPAWKDDVLMDYPKQHQAFNKQTRTIEIR